MRKFVLNTKIKQKVWFMRHSSVLLGLIFAIGCGSSIDDLSVVNTWADALNSTALTLESRGTPSGTAADGTSIGVALSAAGRVVAFTSFATNLVALPDTNNRSDVFSRDLVSEPTPTLVSVNATGTGSGNGSSSVIAWRRALSANGRFIVFQSRATDLVDGVVDVNNADDIFVRDLWNDRTELVSVDAAGTGTGNGASLRPAITADGNCVFFTSLSTNLVGGVIDTNFGPDVFMRDLQTQTTILLSSNTAGTGAGNVPAFTEVLPDATGHFVAFSSAATDFTGVPDGNFAQDVFLVDIEAGTRLLVSQAANGLMAGNGYSSVVDISSDGRYVLFQSDATDLVANGSDTNSAFDVFVFDRTNGRNTLLSRRRNSNDAANDVSLAQAISANGQVVTYASLATDLVSSLTYTPNAWNVFAWNRRTQVSEIVSVDPTGTLANNRAFSAGGVGSFNSQIDGTGRFVIFGSDATHLTPIADANDGADIFLRDRRTRQTKLLSLNRDQTSTANGASFSPSISTDAERAVFHSFADDLVDTASTTDGNAYSVRLP